MLRFVFAILACLLFSAPVLADTPYDGPERKPWSEKETHMVGNVRCDMALLMRSMGAITFDIDYSGGLTNKAHCVYKEAGSFKSIYSCDWNGGSGDYEWYNYGSRAQTCYYLLEKIKKSLQ